MTKGMTPIDDRLYSYVLDVSLRDTPELAGLRQVTAERTGNRSGMQIAPDQGQLMHLMVKLINAKTIVEVGTFTGYSALCMASALPEDGRLIACDISDEWTAIGKPFWEQAGVASKIDLRLGPAVSTLEALLADGLAGQVDMMFIDADKVNYEAYYELGLQLVRPDGIILIDNTLWDGSVADPGVTDADTEAIRALNRKLKTDERVDISLLTVADGLTLARKR
jgi:predicted O-methyltransferase YrrM